jgi:hypothetical protein
MDEHTELDNLGGQRKMEEVCSVTHKSGYA